MNIAKIDDISAELMRKSIDNAVHEICEKQSEIIKNGGEIISTNFETTETGIVANIKYISEKEV